MDKLELLDLLYQHKGEYISGETLSQKLGVSRTTIWNYVNTLKKEGHQIASTTNKGYCLAKATTLIRPYQVAKILGDLPLGNPLISLDTIDSTNTEVKRHATKNAPHGLSVTSLEQTAGRGRRGRSFQSPSGQGLYLSLLLRPETVHEDITNLTAWVAVAVAQGIFNTCGISLGIKWTNDLVWEGKKVCGILTELTLEPDSNFVEYVVVGIGVNLRQTPKDFPPPLRSMATSLEQITGKDIDSSQLCASILLALNQMYSDFPHEKQQYLEEYRNLCVTLGQEVQVLQGTSRRNATAQEIDSDFRLVVQYQEGEVVALSTGEVSVRGMYGYI